MFTGMVSMVGCSAKHADSIADSGDPNVAWTKQKAIECKGDMRTLSAEDQKKLQDLYGFQGAPSRIANAYYQSNGGQ